MSISSALSSALSGLTASSRMAEVTASNVSNALTKGYARREVQLSARHLGQGSVGVTINGVTRNVDRNLLQDLRLSTAGQGARSTTSDFLARMGQALGTPDQSGSLSSRIAVLERSLLEAAARPDVDARLASVVGAARSLAVGLAEISATVQSERQTADARIAADVKAVNAALVGVADLNSRILAFRAGGHDTSALIDQRQQLIDSVAAILPVKEVARDKDQVALFTTGGTVLLDGRPARLEFTATALVTPEMTLASGGLSGLSINGQPVPTSPAGGRLGEGRLSALFDLRDKAAPDAQARIDALARDLVERMASPATDPTLTGGAPGLLTDRGLAFDPANEVGLAGRLRVNPAVVPEAGGALWRLRDGIGATAPGPSGTSDRLVALSAALDERRVQASGGLPAGARSLAGFASDIVSLQSVERLGAEAGTAFATARSDAMRGEMLRDGVDTDQEMQNLLLIEQAYAANARVVKTVDDMINILLGM
jgi:flagellar hook-associated protein 1